jgi:hypothetical protein
MGDQCVISFDTFQREADESYVQIAHFAMAVRLFRAFRSFRPDMRRSPQDITIVAEKVRVRPISLPLMAEPKGKKVLDVDIYARDTDPALHERHIPVTERSGNP